jgi:predicted glycoside hydrolase/deacetylase ChbG (UPF0249 family)
VRRLIINADDLGLTEGVNRAILHARQDGVVTSATLMANGAALPDAVARVRSLSSAPNFSIGCHLSLVDGRPLSDPKSIPSLLKGDSEFRRGIGELGIAAQRGQLSAAEIELEATAQFRALQKAGIDISHYDSHKHAHMFTGILEPALNAAAACGIKAVRNPFESSSPLPLSALLRYPRLLKRYMQVKLLRSMRSKWRRIVQRFGFTTTDGSLGVIVTGDLDERLLRNVLENMPEGTWELVCHPGYDDAELAGIRTRLRASRVQELALLNSPDTRHVIDNLGIELISYRQL